MCDYQRKSEDTEKGQPHCKFVCHKSLMKLSGIFPEFLVLEASICLPGPWHDHLAHMKTGIFETCSKIKICNDGVSPRGEPSMLFHT
jgi:hypothetical protein